MLMWNYIENTNGSTYNYIIFAKTRERADNILQKYFDKNKIKVKMKNLKVVSNKFPDNPEGEGLVAVLEDGWE